ncbi:MAG: hypothetical protein JST04_01615 [Bdellovibrionales bacterium]|nr:hypothetical protein [Bdellovibrionales bacterium]
MLQTLLLSIALSVSVFAPSAHAFLSNAKMPACLDGPDEMRVDNQRVLDMKRTTKNQYLDRAFVEGRVSHLFNDKNGHDHFSIAIGPGPKDTIEIVYNQEFGDSPNFKEGDPVVVCGDYITSNARAGGYDASPDGAIIHWVHFNPGTRANSERHAHGFIMFGADLVGFDEAPTGDWDGRIVKAPQPDGKNPNTEYPRAGSNVRRTYSRQPTRPVYQNRRPSQSGRGGPCRNFQECRSRNGF